MYCMPMKQDDSHPRQATKIQRSGVPISARIGFFLLVVFSVCNSAHSAEWVGTADTNFENGKNWMNKIQGTIMTDPPQAAKSNGTRLSIVNGSGFPLCYTGACGATGFNEQFLIGANKGPTGELKMTGGTLTVQQNFFAIIGQTVEGKMQIQGGTVNLLGGCKDAAIPGSEIKWSLLLGNEPAGKGLVTVSGGELKIESGIEIGRGGSTGIMEISSTGRVHCGGAILFAGGEAPKCVILGVGSGVFEQDSTGELLFLGGANQGWFSFKKGSRGKISLYGYEQSGFERLVTEGRVRIDSQPTTPDHFVFRKVGNQGEYSLAP